MNFINRGAHFAFTRLHARIIEEDGAFTVRVRMLNHLKLDESAFGEEIAATIDMMATTQTTSSKVKPSSALVASAGPAGDVGRGTCSTFLPIRPVRDQVIGPVFPG